MLRHSQLARGQQRWRQLQDALAREEHTQHGLAMTTSRAVRERCRVSRTTGHDALCTLAGSLDLRAT